MRNYDRRPRSAGDIGMRLVILVLASVLILALYVTGYLTPIQSGITRVTSPAQLTTTGVTEIFSDGLNFILELRTIRQRNQELQQRVENLEAELARRKEVDRENEKLRRFFAFAQTYPYLELRGAQLLGRVLGQESTNFLNYVTIDLGTRQGMEIGMPVVTDRGLVGRINSVDELTSKVLLITNPNNYVNVKLETSGLDGVLHGEPGGLLIMDYVEQGPKLSKGELVLTSRLGASFPVDIPVGFVEEIIQRDIDVHQQVIIRPIVEFDRLDLVAVVTNFDLQQRAPAVTAPLEEIAPTATPVADGG